MERPAWINRVTDGFRWIKNVSFVFRELIDYDIINGRKIKVSIAEGSEIIENIFLFHK